MRYVHFADAICIINEQWSLKNNFPWIFPTHYVRKNTRFFYLIKHILQMLCAYLYFTAERMLP